MSVNKKVIKVEDLRVYFHTKKGDSKAVDGNHFTMYENETLAIVGESGCGKSVTAMSILGLVSEPGEIMPGSKIVYMGNVDRDEDENSGTLKRIPKDSYYWYKKVIETNGEEL